MIIDFRALLLFLCSISLFHNSPQIDRMSKAGEERRGKKAVAKKEKKSTTAWSMNPREEETIHSVFSSFWMWQLLLLLFRLGTGRSRADKSENVKKNVKRVLPRSEKRENPKRGRHRGPLAAVSSPLFFFLFEGPYHGKTVFVSLALPLRLLPSSFHFLGFDSPAKRPRRLKGRQILPSIPVI